MQDDFGAPGAAAACVLYSGTEGGCTGAGGGAAAAGGSGAGGSCYSKAAGCEIAEISAAGEAPEAPFPVRNPYARHFFNDGPRRNCEARRQGRFGKEGPVDFQDYSFEAGGCAGAAAGDCTFGYRWDPSGQRLSFPGMPTSAPVVYSRSFSPDTPDPHTQACQRRLRRPAGWRNPGGGRAAADSRSPCRTQHTS